MSDNQSASQEQPDSIVDEDEEVSDMPSDEGQSEEEESVDYSQVPRFEPIDSLNPYDLQVIALILSPDDQTVEQHLRALIFEAAFNTQDYQAYLEAVFAGVESSNGVCRKNIKGPGYSYRCLDCQYHPSSIICEECFNSGDHYGHRVFLEGPGGVCDCGDSLSWKPSANCKKHCGQVKVADLLPEDIKASFIMAVKKAFCLILKWIEITPSFKNSKKTAGLMMKALFEPLKALCSQFSSLIPLVSSIMTSPVSWFGEGLTKQVCMHHDHEDLLRKPISIIQATPCTCSILQLILRHNLGFGKDVQTMLIDLLLFFSSDAQFRNTLAVDYISYYGFYFAFPIESPLNLPRRSKLLDINDQFVLSGSLNNMILHKADIRAFLGCIHSLIHECKIAHLVLANSEIFGKQTVHTLKSLLEDPKTCLEFFANDELRRQFFFILRDFQMARCFYLRSFVPSSSNENLLGLLDELASHNMNTEENFTWLVRGVTKAVFEFDQQTVDRFLISALRSAKQALFGQEGKEYLAYTEITLERCIILFTVAYVFLRKVEYGLLTQRQTHSGELR